MLKMKMRVVLKEKRTETNQTNGIIFPKLGWKWFSGELSALPEGLSPGARTHVRQLTMAYNCL